ncbi:MAG: hypothetical protein TREMPRED_005344 [Tremellales sp. Tagirdzhanova-0007]|nr:MAG: hypothetical protein TREMPRED_005344 [Tremellales sp. Tagirdzhanova-0007]
MTQRYLSRPYSPTSFPTHFPHSLQNLRPYDPSSDRGFYLQPRFVNHIDDHAISELSVFYNDVLPRSGQSTDEVGKASRPLPRVLDICSSWVSHIPLGGAQGGNTTRKPSAREIGMEVIGIGMNAAELAANPILSAWVVHDLNQEPDFASVGPLLEPGRGQAGQVVSPEDLSTPFDAVICNVSIDYLSRPLEIMSSIARALRPGGEAYMAISNRCFPTKVVSPWLEMSTTDRINLVASYFYFAGTPYANGTPSTAQQGPQPGQLFEGIESLVIVPEGRREDPLWIVRAKKRADDTPG